MISKSGLKKRIFILSAVGLVATHTSFVLLFWFAVANAGKDIGAIISWVLIAVLLNISLTVFLGKIAIKKVQKPLVELTQAAEQIAEGNLDVIIEYEGDDEIGDLARVFDRMRETLAGSFNAIREHINELQGRVKELTVVTEIDSAILDGRSLESILDLTTERICKLIDGDYCLIALVNKRNDHMQIKSSSGFTHEEKKHLFKRLGNKIINCDLCLSLISGEATVVEDLDKSHLSDEAKEICSCFGAKSMLAAPLTVEDKTIGSIVVWYKSAQVFDETATKRFRLFANQTSIAIKSATLVDDMRNLTVETMRTLANAIDARDSYTANHSDRVSRFSVALAQELGLNPDEVQALEYAGLLHDIGKIGIDESILNKPSSLTEEEMVVMKNHAFMSAEIVKPIEFLADTVPIIRHHHEWFNGKGYPSGLAGNEIPLGARILAVADALEAITSDRPYSKSLTIHEGLERIQAGSGIQFDPEVVRAMAKVVERIESVDDYELNETANSGFAIDSDHFELEDAV